MPPRPSRHHLVGAEAAARRAHGSWPAVEAEPLGDWVLRASGGFSARANSVLLAGDPGRDWDEALGSVEAFYADRGLPAWAQVTVGSAEQQRLQDETGWALARPGEADSEFHVAGVAKAARACATLMPPTAPVVVVHDHLTTGWLATDDRAREHGEPARQVLEGPAHSGFGTVTEHGAVVARGRIAFPADDDWAGSPTSGSPPTAAVAVSASSCSTPCSAGRPNAARPRRTSRSGRTTRPPSPSTTGWASRSTTPTGRVGGGQGVFREGEVGVVGWGWGGSVRVA